MTSHEHGGQPETGPARFEVTAEPFGCFLVFDNQTERPAEIEAATLIGLERDEAEVLCRFLNARASKPSARVPLLPEPRRTRRWPPRVAR